MAERIHEYDCSIGYALEIIPPFQLRSYFALLHDMVSFSELVSNEPSDPSLALPLQHFEMRLRWPTGKVTTEWYPPHVAPSSSVLYMVGRLGLRENKNIMSMDWRGYQNVQQIGAEIRSHSMFWKTERYITCVLHVLQV